MKYDGGVIADNGKAKLSWLGETKNAESTEALLLNKVLSAATKTTAKRFRRFVEH